MKRIISYIFIIVCTLSLSGCRVNWFDKTYDVKWYYIAIPVAIIFIIAHLHIMSGRYVCPKCNKEIELKWYQIYAYVHFGGGRYMVCPHCKCRGFCKRKKH